MKHGTKLLSVLLTAAMAIVALPMMPLRAAGVTVDSFGDRNVGEFIFQDLGFDQGASLSDSQLAGVTTINISSWYASGELKGLNVFPNLTTLIANMNSLTSVDLSGCRNLTDVNLTTNNISSINLTGCTSLKKLEIGFNNSLSSINVSNCTALTTLDLRNTSVSSLNITGISELILGYESASPAAIGTNTAYYFMDRNLVVPGGCSVITSGAAPTVAPTATTAPSAPTSAPVNPTTAPAATATPVPSAAPVATAVPTRAPVNPTTAPVATSTPVPTTAPVATEAPSAPTSAPVNPTARPTRTPTMMPTASPTPTDRPANNPSQPTDIPEAPTNDPVAPTSVPSQPTAVPGEPTTAPEAAEGIEGFCERLYTCALFRPAEEAGRDYWANELRHGATGASVAEGFFFSEEMINSGIGDQEFILRLYLTFMDREQSSDEMDYWLNEMMNNGMTREEVFAGFIHSEEWANICLLYGINSGGNGIPSITVEPSDGVIAFATRLYTTCLERDPDPAGLEYWAAELANRRVSGTEAARAYFFSQEFIDARCNNIEYICRLYLTFMGREYEQSGLDYWMGQMTSGATREDVFNGFAASAEFGDICAEYGIIR